MTYGQFCLTGNPTSLQRRKGRKVPQSSSRSLRGSWRLRGEVHFAHLEIKALGRPKVQLLATF